MARGPKPAPVTLSPKERAALEALVRRGSAGQALVQRARIVWTCLVKVESSSVKDEVFNVRTEKAVYA